VTFPSLSPFGRLKYRAGVLEEVAGPSLGLTNLTGKPKQPEHLENVEVSPNYFFHARTIPEIGRLFGPQDFALGFAEATVIKRWLVGAALTVGPNILGKR